MVNACVGLLFFGVPNRGLKFKNLQTLVKDQRNELLIRNLGEESHYLRVLHQQFLQSFRFDDCANCSFFESDDTPSVVVSTYSDWMFIFTS